MPKTEELEDVDLGRGVDDPFPDDHADKAYVNVRVISGTILSSVSALVCFIGVILIWFWKEQLPEEGKEAKPKNWVNCHVSLYYTYFFSISSFDWVVLSYRLFSVCTILM